jgi:hypothetical protein
VRRDVFLQLGGFDSISLFEDIIFSKKLKKIGKIYVLNKKIYTSDRRWERQGIIKATLINWLMTAGFICGISSEKLKKIYYDIR